jgi:hypothetical protein
VKTEQSPHLCQWRILPSTENEGVPKTDQVNGSVALENKGPKIR